MAQWDIPDEDTAKGLSNNPLFGELLDADLNLPDFVTVQGYVVQSPQPGRWQVYTDRSLGRGIEVAAGDILKAEDLDDPMDGSLVMIRRRGDVRRIGPGGSAGDYLSGAIGGNLGGFAPDHGGPAWQPEPTACGQCSTKSRC